MEEWITMAPVRRLAAAEVIADGLLLIFKNDFFSGRVLEIDGGF